MKNYIILLLTVLLCTSCQEDITSNLKQIENQLKTENTSTSTFTLKNDTILKGKLGTEIFIPKDLFANYTNGKITFELKEYFSKEDIILNGLSTITDKDELLESSGMIYINFTEEGKQLTIKEGKRYKAQLPNKILANSNLYSNANDSIFKWEFIEGIQRDTAIIDILKNAAFGITVDKTGAGGFFKNVKTDSVSIIQKRDSLLLIKNRKESKKREIQNQIIAETNMSEFDFGDPSFGDFTEADTTVTTEQLEKQYKMYQKFYDFDTFASSKLGWINCDRVLNVEKEVTLQLSLKNHKNITHFSVYYIYKNYKTFLKESYRSTPALSKNFKVSGRTKVVVMSTTNDTYLYDFFYVNKSSKTNFEINLKETTLDNLKKVLISQ
ncbi:MAG: hypothetical protein CMP76_04220 [Flavobacterium sp.]|uniref:hypothetical protein n=1 Tax=Flavobacterium sp. TaxID=239 RepID=UPI000C3BBBA5|nr:hypothetical protein [Flavobacterium sp.]MBF02483.1 hypothetical protein [Flavobacterium sp.]